MEEELKYTSKFNGEDTDSILEGAKKVINAELPSLDEIGGFMVYDKEGKAIGLMSSEQVAQVVGGLIGGATDDKDGLMSRYYAIRRLVTGAVSGRYFMFKLSGYRPYGTFEFIANTDDGRMLLCTVTFSGYTGNPIKPALIKNKEFYGHLKFYRKEGENNTIYFQLFTGSNATSLFIRCLTANNYVSDVESSDEPAESLIEIPMS